MPTTIQDRLKGLQAEGQLKTLWSKYKAGIYKGVDEDDKAALDELYKSFDGDLSKRLKKFEESTSYKDALKQAQKTSEVCASYAAKVAASDVSSAKAKIGLKGLLEELQTFVDAKAAEIEEMRKSVAGRIKLLAQHGDLKKLWKTMKDHVAKTADKDDKAILSKLYATLDGGLTKVIGKYEKAEDAADARRYAEEAVVICKDYEKKILDAELGAEAKMTLSGLAKSLRKFFKEQLAAVED